MPELRKCYRDLVAKHPTSVGSLSIRVTLEQGNAPPVLESRRTAAPSQTSPRACGA